MESDQTQHKKGLVNLKFKAQSCPTLCDPMDCSLPGSSVHGIFQAVWIFHTGVGCHLVNLRCSNKNYPRWASQVALVVKNLPTNSGDIRNAGSIRGSRRFSCRSIWQFTPLFFPGESHGHRILAGYSLQGHKASDMTEATQHAQDEGQKKAERISRTLVSCGATSVP